MLARAGMIIRLGVQEPLILLEHAIRTLSKRQRQLLHTVKFRAAEHDHVVDRVDRRRQLVVPDHAADDRAHRRHRQLKHGGEMRERERVVIRHKVEQICSQAFLLDMPGKDLKDGVFLREQLPDLDRLDQLDTPLPLAALERLARLHDMVPRVLRRA